MLGKTRHQTNFYTPLTLQKMEKIAALDILTEAKELFEPIPNEQWLENDFSNEINACCVIGHYQRLTSSDPLNFDIKNCHDIDLAKSFLTVRFFKGYLRQAFFSIGIDIALVNNGRHNAYPQPTPKARVMAVLTDAIAQLQKELAA